MLRARSTTRGYVILNVNRIILNEFQTGCNAKLRGKNLIKLVKGIKVEITVTS